MLLIVQEVLCCMNRASYMKMCNRIVVFVADY